MTLALRPYQEDARQRVGTFLDSGGSRLCIVAPCGSGKTVLATALIRDCVARGGRVLFLAHRQELILQTSRKLDAAYQAHGVIMADHPRVAPSQPVQVASIQTVVRRLDAMQRGRGFDMIIPDECHRARSDSFARVFEAFPTATVLGLTATPERTDGRGLGELFTDLMQVTTTRALIEQGWLVPYRAFVFDSDELDALDKVRLKEGDYDPKGAAKVMGGRAVIGRVVEEWATRSAGRRSVYFAASVERSRELAAEFNELRRHGGPVCYAEHLDASSPDVERQGIMGPGGRLERGETTVVTNCSLFTEGTDVPSIETVGLVSPTLSWARAVQMMGRGLRPSPETGKTDLLILDHARVLLTHGRPDDPRELTLSPDRVRTPRPKKSERTNLLACDRCGCIYPMARAKCGECGTPNPQWTPPDVRVLESDRVLELHSAQTDETAKRDRFRHLLLEQRRSRRRPGYAVDWFRRQFGHEPPGEWLADDAGAQGAGTVGPP